jgi:hypothetical protein
MVWHDSKGPTGQGGPGPGADVGGVGPTNGGWAASHWRPLRHRNGGGGGEGGGGVGPQIRRSGEPCRPAVESCAAPLSHPCSQGSTDSDGAPPATLYVPTNTRNDDAVQKVLARRRSSSRIACCCCVCCILLDGAGAAPGEPVTLPAKSAVAVATARIFCAACARRADALVATVTAGLITHGLCAGASDMD